MNLKLILFLVLAVMPWALSSLEQSYILKNESGLRDPLFHAVCRKVLDEPSLKLACKNIRALSHTNNELYTIINHPYNTRVLIKELAQKYTYKKAIQPAMQMKTAGAANLLYEKTYEFTINPALSCRLDNPHYLSLLPPDLFKILVSNYSHQTIAVTYNFLKRCIDHGILADDFKAIKFLAATYAKSDLLGAALLLNTPYSKGWSSIIKPSGAEYAQAYYFKAGALKELQRFQEAEILLQDAAHQGYNLYIKAKAQLELACWYFSSKEHTKENLAKISDYAAYAANQNDCKSIREDANIFCLEHGFMDRRD